MRADPVREEAALWRIRLEEGSADLDAFEAWLKGDIRRRREFENVQSVWGFVDSARDEPLMRQARKELFDRLRAARRRRRAMIGGSLAAGLAVVAVFMALFVGRSPQMRIFETNQSRRAVQLEDGSTVLLDTGSRLVVRYTLRRRDLTLQRGQARFDVAHDSERPFSVIAGPERVIATGTAFNIEVSGQAISVALLQGRVTIVPPTGTAHVPVDLRQGEQFVSGLAGRTVSRFDPDAVTAWESGHIIFSDTPLDEAVRRVNRYAERPILSLDPATARFKVNGLFKAGDTNAFAEAVSALLPVDALCEPGGAINLAPREIGEITKKKIPCPPGD